MNTHLAADDRRPSSSSVNLCQGFLDFRNTLTFYLNKKMSINSWFHSEFLSCNDVINQFHAESLPSSINPFLSPQVQQLEDPPTDNTHQAASSCNFVYSCNSETPSSHLAPSNPPLMATLICNSSHPNDGRVWNKLPGSVSADKKNRIMIERQRRKDMNELFATLSSLLPDENLRGKRAVSDQVQEAVNYVRHLQQKVEDLSTEREKMKANSDENAKVSLEGVRLSSNEKICIKAQPIGGSDREFPTVKIKSMGSTLQVCTNTFEHQIVFSDLLLAIEEGGLEVVSAASSAINNRIFHTIHTKVCDLETLNIDTLEQKLWHLIRTNHTEDQEL